MAPLLELLHPDGLVRSVRVFGNNCSEDALACPPARTGAGPADLIVVAPDIAQAASPEWIEETAAAAAGVLHPDGFVYVAAPPQARRPLIAALRRHGLAKDRTYIQHPEWPSGNVLIPVTHAAISYAYSKLIPTRRWRRHLALAALRLPLALYLMGEAALSAGIVMRRKGAAPLARWFFAATDSPAGKGDVILNASWRGGDGAVVLVRFGNRNAPPDAIGKAVLSQAMAGNYEREAETLRVIAPLAAKAGAHVPVLLAQTTRGEYPVLIESLAPGVPARPLLEGDAGRLRPVMDRLTAWLAKWHRLTCRTERLSPAHLAGFWLEPASVLAPLMPRGAAYREWLENEGRRCLGAAVPLVAAHNDLTMMNVMVSEGANQDRLGIIDWEAARQDGLPLMDFCYAMVDAVMYAAYPNDRPAAFAACFARSGPYASWSAALQESLVLSTGLSPDLARLSFHACWLYHARTEMESGLDDARPFLAILNGVAEDALVGKESAF